MTPGKLASVLSTAAALGCGGEAAVPDMPTWAEHVEPILRANCFHCHGASANYKDFRTKRWDVFDLSDESYQRMGFGKVFEDILFSDGTVKKVATFFGATEPDHPPLVDAYCDPGAAADQRMPPPPGTALSAQELQILKRWGDLLSKGVPAATLKGSHHPNHKPLLSWAAPGLLAVRDEDGDQVLGKLDCQGVELRILHTGGWTLPAGARPPCRGTLYDGYEEQAVTLE